MTNENPTLYERLKAIENNEGVVTATIGLMHGVDALFFPEIDYQDKVSFIVTNRDIKSAEFVDDESSVGSHISTICGSSPRYNPKRGETWILHKDATVYLNTSEDDKSRDSHYSDKVKIGTMLTLKKAYLSKGDLIGEFIVIDGTGRKDIESRIVERLNEEYLDLSKTSQDDLVMDLEMWRW